MKSTNFLRTNRGLKGLILSSCLGLTLVAKAAGPDDAAIKTVLKERIDKAKQGVGIVVGIVDEHGSRVISYGKFQKGGERNVDGDTLFEIGSATKVFTSLLLADMVGRHQAQLDDPVSEYLPASVKMPTRGGKDITLLDLATHSSGLPRLPDNLSPAHADNPYADYTVAQLYEFLSGYKLTRDIGTEYEYSNLGVGLLGHALALRAGTNYESLVRQRITQPLGMNATAITLTSALKERLASGHGPGGVAVANWDIPTLAGAGALRSSANDLLKFISANLGVTPSDLFPAMKLQHQPRRGAGAASVRIGLGWHITTKFGTDLVWHNGGTGGYHSFMGFDPKKKLGVVVLANSAYGIDDIGLHVLEPQYSLAKFNPATNHTATKVSATTLTTYGGRYELAPSVFFNIRTKGDHLEAQLTGQPYVDIYPETETKFFYTVVDAQITFQKDSIGKVTALVLHQNQIDQKATKISDTVPAEPTAAKVDPKIYDRYAGRYELAPGVIFTVKRQADHLMVQLTGQTFLEVFPASETEFFYKVVDAKISFSKNAAGAVTSLTLHQNGRDQPARRLP